MISMKRRIIKIYDVNVEWYETNMFIIIYYFNDFIFTELTPDKPVPGINS